MALAELCLGSYLSLSSLFQNVRHVQRITEKLSHITELLKVSINQLQNPRKMIK